MRNAVHHIELWTGDLPGSADAFGWILAELGWQADHDPQWPQGRTWRHPSGVYLVLEQSPDVSGPHDRHRAGLNHLALRADSREQLDGLRASCIVHLRAGNTQARTIQVHGNTDFMRPISGDRTPIPIPASVPKLEREDPITDEIWAQLVSRDGRPTRPHVLWFDEYYEEELYRSQSAIDTAAECDLYVVVGTSGAAAIPYHMGAAALQNDAAVIDINPDDNPFAEHARDRAAKGKGLWLQGSGTQWVPALVERLLAI